jgi:hypothetical protein
MDPIKMVFVFLMSKKEDLVVETRTIKNNVILHVNVDILAVISLCLELVKKYPQDNINHPHNQFRQGATPMAMIVVFV